MREESKIKLTPLLATQPARKMAVERESIEKKNVSGAKRSLLFGGIYELGRSANREGSVGGGAGKNAFRNFAGHEL